MFAPEELWCIRRALSSEGHIGGQFSGSKLRSLAGSSGRIIYFSTVIGDLEVDPYKAFLGMGGRVATEEFGGGVGVRRPLVYFLLVDLEVLLVQLLQDFPL